MADDSRMYMLVTAIVPLPDNEGDRRRVINRVVTALEQGEALTQTYFCEDGRAALAGRLDQVGPAGVESIKRQLAAREGAWAEARR